MYVYILGSFILSLKKLFMYVYTYIGVNRQSYVCVYFR